MIQDHISGLIRKIAFCDSIKDILIAKNSFSFFVILYLSLVNYQLSKKFRLLGNGDFNYLTIILTTTNRFSLIISGDTIVSSMS